ncbi:MAG: flagellin [Pseudomonadota bacterium]|jgi:flagellin
MGLRITGSQTVEGNLRRATEEAANSLEKLSSGSVFTRSEPQPADRSLSDRMTQRLREFASHKRSANDAISLVETADAALNEVGNITNRLQELATQASSPTLSDKERKFIFVEYESLRDEIDRIAKNTQFNGVNLLSNAGGEVDRPELLQFRIGQRDTESGETDAGVAILNGFRDIVATAENLGIQSLRTLIGADGISLDDVESVFGTDITGIGETFLDAFEKISGFRADFGAISSRMNRALNAIDVATENVSAAQSRIRDVDYATEISNLTKANILVQAGTSLLAHANVPAQLVLTLIRNLD